MTITVEAVYENGVLRPTQPLPFAEHEQVQVTVAPARQALPISGDVVRDSYGMLGWRGTHEEFERILAETEEFEDLP